MAQIRALIAAILEQREKGTSRHKQAKGNGTFHLDLTFAGLFQPSSFQNRFQTVVYLITLYIWPNISFDNPCYEALINRILAYFQGWEI